MKESGQAVTALRLGQPERYALSFVPLKLTACVTVTGSTASSWAITVENARPSVKTLCPKAVSSWSRERFRDCDNDRLVDVGIELNRDHVHLD